MISSISFCGREECLTKLPVKGAKSVFHEYRSYSEPIVNLPNIKPEVIELPKAKYFPPFANHVENKKPDIVIEKIEEGTFFG